jgi:serine protease Do
MCSSVDGEHVRLHYRGVAMDYPTRAASSPIIRTHETRGANMNSELAVMGPGVVGDPKAQARAGAATAGGRAALRALLASFAVLVAVPAAPGMGQEVRDVFDKVSPSVVVIRGRGRDVGVKGRGLTYINEIGSGVVVSADGNVMTAAHVVQAMDEITVEFVDGRRATAHVISSEPAADLALLRVDTPPPSPIVALLGNSDNVRVGDEVLIVGAPYGLGRSLSVGWISARYPPNTVYRAMPLAEFFQTTAPINQGNSGGPMFDRAGRLIGIVSHNISKSGGSEGLGFVVTSNSARRLLLEDKTFWTGIEGQAVTGELAEIFNVPQPAGYLVKAVAEGSPAWKAGIQGGDRVARINGEDIVVRGDIILAVGGVDFGLGEAVIRRIRERMERAKSGEALTVKVLRAGKVLEVIFHVP